MVAARTSDDVILSRTSAVLMAAAGAIAAVGMVTNNVILLVGTMIVSPDSAPSRAASRSSAVSPRAPAPAGCRSRSASRSRRRWRSSGRAWPACPSDPGGVLLGTVPGDLIETPNLASVIVAVTAGIAGMIALGQTKSGAVVGVLVSVTTIPAAANIGVALAMGQVPEALGSLGRLLSTSAGWSWPGPRRS